MRTIQLKCESDEPCFDQGEHEVAVEHKDDTNWYGKATANPNYPTLQWPKFAWKEIGQKKGSGKRGHARLTQAPTLTLKGEEIDAQTKL